MASAGSPAEGFQQLLRQVAELKSKLHGIAQQSKEAPAPEVSFQSSQAAPPKPARQKVERMSTKVSESNPYSRLMALERMGVVKNYETIREKSVLIVGLGGIGAVAVSRAVVFLFLFFLFFFLCVLGSLLTAPAILYPTLSQTEFEGKGGNVGSFGRRARAAL